MLSLQTSWENQTKSKMQMGFLDKIQSSKNLDNFLGECDFNYQMHHTKEQFELYLGILNSKMRSLVYGQNGLLLN